MTDRQHAQQRITACWNTASKSYDATPGHGIMSDAERIAWTNTLSEALPPPPADVLDVGTGTGFMAFRAHELGHRVHGIDLSEEMLGGARNAARDSAGAPQFAIGDAIMPDFAPASFDAVMNRHLLWTLTDPERALHNWRELLRPGGRLIVIDGIWGNDDKKDDEEHGDDDGGHPGDDYYTPDVLASLPVTRMMNVAEVVALLETAGFHDVREIDLTAIDEAEGHLDATRGRYGLVAGR